MAFKIGKGVQQLPFSDVLDSTFLELLVELVEMGALISIGASRDKGAVKVTVTVNGEWDGDWFRTDEELHLWLKEAVVVVRGLDPQPSTESRRRRGALKPV